MKLKSFQGGFDKNFSYLIWCEESGDAAIIDPAVEILPIIEEIESNNLVLGKILITHTHNDHIQFLDDLIYEFPLVQICGHPEPLKKISHGYRPLDHYENLSIGGEMITVLHTPGHYGDSLCYWNLSKKQLFTGDTMFVGRTGRTISTNSCISKLYESVYNILLKLPLDTMIYPGHHYGHIPNISLSNNIKLSSFFQCTSKNEFINVMKNYEKNRNRG